jgi:co-chaperonin GroES (HSP10)
MRPIGKKILIDPIVEKVETKTGLVLSKEDTDQLRYKRGRIISTGDEVTPHIKEGDIVHYDTRAGYTMRINGEAVTLISEVEVVVVE